MTESEKLTSFSATRELLTDSAARERIADSDREIAAGEIMSIHEIIRNCG
ncbi:MAG: hypothetical protein H7288_05190 [Kineosporiaceae bacterium]|nr:hypothetical protein [Aeromicrobium sp.]